MRRPEIKQGVNKGTRVYWVNCPKCGNSPEKKSKAGASHLRRTHDCEEGWGGARNQ